MKFLYIIVKSTSETNKTDLFTVNSCCPVSEMSNNFVTPAREMGDFTIGT